MANIKAVQRFVDQLPGPDQIKPQPRDYWQRLDVWHERILTERLHDAGLITKRLNQLGLGFLQVLNLWLGLGVETKNKAVILQALAGCIAKNPRQIWCQDLFLLIEFVENKDYEAVETIGQIILPAAITAIIVDSSFIPRAQRLAYAMQLYYTNPAHLPVLRLFEEAEKPRYTRYILIPKAEEGDKTVPDLEAMEADKKINTHFDLTKLTVEEVNKALVEFESRLPQGKRSICARILQENEDSALVFIRRVLKEASIEEIDRTLFGDQIEIIVLKFSHGLRVLEEHSSRKVGVGIAGAIASRLLEAKVEYLDDSTKTAAHALQHFLQELWENKNSTLRLVEIYLSQAPLEDSPTLIIRCDKQKSLAAPLDDLQRRSVHLLELETLQETLKDVRHISVAYDRLLKGKPAPYIFRLRIYEVKDGSYFVRYARQRLSRAFRSEFENYLRETYGVKAIPGT